MQTEPCQPWGSGDNSVVRALDLWSKGRGFNFLQEQQENFFTGHGSPVSAISHSLVDRLTPIALSLTPGHA